MSLSASQRLVQTDWWRVRARLQEARRLSSDRGDKLSTVVHLQYQREVPPVMGWRGSELDAISHQRKHYAGELSGTDARRGDSNLTQCRGRI